MFGIDTTNKKEKKKEKEYKIVIINDSFIKEKEIDKETAQSISDSYKVNNNKKETILNENI